MARLAIAELAPLHVSNIGAVGASFANDRELPADEGALIVAPLVGDAIVLGRFQRARSAIDLQISADRALPIVGRATGGCAIHAGVGQVYVALALARAGALGGVDDPSRILNRHVRPLLAALSSLGVTAASGGREVVIVRGDAIAFVSVAHHRASGRVLLEAFVSHDRPFSLDPALDLAAGSIEPRFAGKRASTLSATIGRALGHEELVAAIVAAHRRAANGSTMSFVPALGPSPVVPDAPAFTAMIEESAGLIGAIVEPDHARVALGADLIASHDAIDALARALFTSGPASTDESLLRTIDAHLAPASGAMTLGIRRLDSLAKLVRAAWSAFDAQKHDAREP